MLLQFISHFEFSVLSEHVLEPQSGLDFKASMKYTIFYYVLIFIVYMEL